MNKQTTWPPAGATQRILELKQLLELVRSSPLRESYEPHLVRYLAVRSAALVEAVRDDVASQFTHAVGHKRIHRRVSLTLSRSLGVRPRQLVDFVSTFDQDWGNTLNNWLEENDAARKNALGALVSARNEIAHGNSGSVSSSQAILWAELAIQTSKWLIDTFDPR